MSNTYKRDTKLAQRMQTLGYTVRELSEGSGVDRWLLNDHLMGRRQLSPMLMVRVCAFLKCEPEAISY